MGSARTVLLHQMTLPMMMMMLLLFVRFVRERGEIARYLMDAAKRECPLVYDHDGSFGDPLKWWKVNGVRFPYVANASYLLGHSSNFDTL
jgi:hypothetical protein